VDAAIAGVGAGLLGSSPRERSPRRGPAASSSGATVSVPPELRARLRGFSTTDLALEVALRTYLNETGN